MMTLETIFAEWTKLRSVRGWCVALLLVVLGTVLFGYLVANGVNSGVCTPTASGGQTCAAGHPFVPTGPNGEAVADSYYVVRRQLTGDGAITARVSRLTGVTSSAPANAAPTLSRTKPGISGWAKAGLMITASTRQGSQYAAVMATADHGVRFQYDYIHDIAGIPGTALSNSPRWLRLTRTGERVTAYDSTNATSWHAIGAVTLRGLRSSVGVGLFVTSPVTYGGLATMATGTFDHVTLTGATAKGQWHAAAVGEDQNQFYDVLGHGGYDHAGGSFTVTGSGDVAAAVTASGETAASLLLQALIVALIVVAGVAATFITSEYRRGLIHTTIAAIPGRIPMLGAKTLVIGAAVFLAGVIAAAITVPLGEHLLRSHGSFVFPTTVLTEARIILGTGLFLALTGVCILAIGTLVRRSSGTVLASIVLFVLPVIITVPFTSSGQGGANPTWVEWLLRVTPAAGLSIVTSLPRSSLVSYPYKLSSGYLPLSPAAGLAVLCAWTIALLSLAALRLQRSDA